jgi:ribonuclease BN (tRNA processing enzyme)
MELIVLGSGCFAPPKPGGYVRNPSGYALRVGGRALLFDFGFGNLRQLVKAGVDPSTISHVFITHNHLDHVGDLAALLFYFRYDDKPRGGRLTLMGYPGFKKWLKNVSRAYSPYMTPRGYKLEVKEMSPSRPYSADGFKVSAHKVPHFTPCQAYKLEADGRTFVYSGDTGYSESLARFAAGADLFTLECTQPASNPLPDGHLTAKDALRLVDLAAPRRALLSHLSDGSAGEAKRLARGRRDVMIARDLLKLKV